MKQKALAGICAWLIFSAVSAAAETRPAPAYATPSASSPVPAPVFSYIIGPGDQLDISVWRHPDLAAKVIVRPDGNISFPFVGEVKALDLTIPELTDKIKYSLVNVVNQPIVTVNVLSFQNQKVFVLGEVALPGVFPFDGRITVVEALSRAHGYKADTAQLNSVVVIRRGGPGGQGAQGFRLNIWDVINKGDFSQDITLVPGDIVYVPKTFIANITTFIQEFFTKTDPAVKFYLDMYDAVHPGVLNR